MIVSWLDQSYKDEFTRIMQAKSLWALQYQNASRPIMCFTLFQFVFESEKEASATAKLLSEIRQGVKLKKVKTKDRSKPMLEGE